MSEKKLRICITSNDIAKIECCSIRSASQKMQDIRVFSNKTDKRFKVTFTDYASYSGISIDELEPFRNAS